MFAPEKLLHVVQGAKDYSTRRALENLYLEVFAAQTYYEARPVEGLDRDETLARLRRLADSRCGRLVTCMLGRTGLGRPFLLLVELLRPLP